MAYVSTEDKAKIAEALKAVVPKNWKYTLSVDNHSTIVMTIKSGPSELIEGTESNYQQLNPYHLDRDFKGEVLEILLKIKDALNTDNYDNSDIMTDYFDVGHYVHINVGRWNKPFIVTHKGNK